MLILLAAFIELASVGVKGGGNAIAGELRWRLSQNQLKEMLRYYMPRIECKVRIPLDAQQIYIAWPFLLLMLMIL